MTLRKLETSQFFLRHIDKQDESAFLTLVTAPSVEELSTTTAKEAFENVLNNYNDVQNVAFWSVIEKKESHFIGFVGYRPVILEDAQTQIIFMDFYAPYWESDIPETTLSLLCKDAFITQGISTLTALIHPDDIQRTRCIEKAGFQFENNTLAFGVTSFKFVKVHVP